MMIVTSGMNSYYILKHKEGMGSLCMFNFIYLLPQYELGADFQNALQFLL